MPISDMQNHVDFHNAVDRLRELGFTSRDFAIALGCSVHYFACMRLWNGSSPSHRHVPARHKWEPAFRNIARSRAAELGELVSDLMQAAV